MSPRRIQRQRTAGWKMPEGALYVGRPTAYGNPFPWQGEQAAWWALAVGERADLAGRRRAVVIWYRWWITGGTTSPPLKKMEPQPKHDIEYTSGRTASTLDLVAGLGTMMLVKDGPVKLPIPPDVTQLRGLDLVCWCPPDGPCHADVLLELANE